MPPGRSSKLTPEFQERMLNFVRGGAPLEVAAVASGIAAGTFWDWMAAGEGRASSIHPSKVLTDFAEKVRRAEAETHALVIGTVRTAAITDHNWQAALAYARMRWSKFYADRVEITGSEGEPLIAVDDHEKVLLRKAIDEYLTAHPEEVEVEA